MRKYSVVSIVTVFLAALFLLAGVAVAQTTCEVPGDLKLVITNVSWTFDPESGTLEGEAELLNVWAQDVVAPGIIVGAFGVDGEEINRATERGEQMRLQKGDSTKVSFSMVLDEAPVSVLVAPFDGVKST